MWLVARVARIEIFILKELQRIRIFFFLFSSIELDWWRNLRAFFSKQKKKIIESWAHSTIVHNLNRRNCSIRKEIKPAWYDGLAESLWQFAGVYGLQNPSKVVRNSSSIEVTSFISVIAFAIVYSCRSWRDLGRRS